MIMKSRRERNYYLTPQTELVSVKLEHFADILSWNPDAGHGPNLPTYEGDPDSDNDGKGAKENDIWDESRFTSRALWDE